VLINSVRNPGYVVYNIYAVIIVMQLTVHVLLYVLTSSRESSSVIQQASNQTDMTSDSSSRGQVKEVLWDFDDEDDMEL